MSASTHILISTEQLRQLSDGTTITVTDLNKGLHKISPAEVDRGRLETLAVGLPITLDNGLTVS